MFCLRPCMCFNGRLAQFIKKAADNIDNAVAQPPLASGDGPIALIMAPTRELVVQIGKDVKRFARQLNLTCVCAYGGAALGTQISELKRGTEARPSAVVAIISALPALLQPVSCYERSS